MIGPTVRLQSSATRHGPESASDPPRVTTVGIFTAHSIRCSLPPYEDERSIRQFQVYISRHANTKRNIVKRSASTPFATTASSPTPRPPHSSPYPEPRQCPRRNHNMQMDPPPEHQVPEYKRSIKASPPMSNHVRFQSQEYSRPARHEKPPPCDRGCDERHCTARATGPTPQARQTPATTTFKPKQTTQSHSHQARHCHNFFESQ